MCEYAFRLILFVGAAIKLSVESNKYSLYTSPCWSFRLLHCPKQFFTCSSKLRKAAFSNVYVVSRGLLTSTCISQSSLDQVYLQNHLSDSGEQDLAYSTHHWPLIEMAPDQLEARQKGKPWPGFFLVRTTGEVIPLIALDELPLNIEVVGVPRFLDLEEAMGMVNLGLHKNTGGFYQIVQERDRKIQGSEVICKTKYDPRSSTRNRTNVSFQ